METKWLLLIAALILCMSSFSLCASLASAGAGGYFWLQSQPDDEEILIDNYFCGKDMSFCVLKKTDPIPTKPQQSKWFRVHSSCVNCVGTYYWMPGIQRLSSVSLLLQNATTVEEVEDALDGFKISLTDETTCIGLTLKSRKYNESCLTLQGPKGDVVKQNVDSLYGVVLNGLMSQLKDGVRNAYIAKVMPPGTRMQDADPFHVLCYLADKELRTKRKQLLGGFLPSPLIPNVDTVCAPVVTVNASC